MDFAAAFPVSQALLIRRKQADEHEQSTLGIVTSSPSHVSLQQPYSQIVRGQTVPHRLPTKLIQHV